MLLPLAGSILVTRRWLAVRLSPARPSEAWRIACSLCAQFRLGTPVLPISHSAGHQTGARSEGAARESNRERARWPADRRWSSGDRGSWPDYVLRALHRVEGAPPRCALARPPGSPATATSACPGDLLHLDPSEYAYLQHPAHPVTGDRRSQEARRQLLSTLAA
jgi:hypothetical protein